VGPRAGLDTVSREKFSARVKKGKVVPVLSFLPEHYAMKAYWGVEV